MNSLAVKKSVAQAVPSSSSPSCAPFLSDRVSDPFMKEFVDIESLNSSAFEAILNEIKRVNKSSGKQSRGLLILGEPGTGKTHLLARVYHNLRSKNYMLWVSNPGNPEGVFSFTWLEIVRSLTQRGESEVHQAEELLSRAFASLLERGIKDGETSQGKNLDYWNLQIHRVRNKEPLGDELDTVRNRVLDIWQKCFSGSSQDSMFIRGLFNYLVYQDRKKQRAIFEWLTNFEYEYDPDTSQIQLELWTRVTEDSSGVDLVGRREAWALKGIRVIAELATYADRPMILAFDQLEAMRGNSELTKAWGNTVRQIIDEARNLVVVTCIFPSLWKDWFTKDELNCGPPLDVSAQDRIAQNQVDLEQLSYKDASSLVSRRLESYLEPDKMTVYRKIFDSDFIRATYDDLAGRLSVRRFLKKCHEKFVSHTDEYAEVDFEARSVRQLIMRTIELGSIPAIPEPDDHQIRRVEELISRLIKPLGIEVKQRMRLENKVLPSHVTLKINCANGNNQLLALGLINRYGVSLTSRLKNWSRLAQKEKNVRFVLFRSSGAKIPKQTTQSWRLLEELQVRNMREEVENRVRGYYDVMTLILEKKLEAADRNLEIGDLCACFDDVDKLALESALQIELHSRDPIVPVVQSCIAAKPLSVVSVCDENRVQVSLVNSCDRPMLPTVEPYDSKKNTPSSDEIAEVLDRIQYFCKEFDLALDMDRIEANDIIPTPNVITLNIPRLPGIECKQIEKCEKDLELNLQKRARIYANIPLGRISIEVERREPKPLDLKYALSLLPRTVDDSEGILLPIGIGSQGQFLRCDLRRSHNMLIGGTTGSGKTNFIKCVLATMVSRYFPQQVQFNIFDPKQIDFQVFKRVSTGHLRCFATEIDDINSALSELVEEMERRYGLMARRNIDSIDSIVDEGFPKIVSFVDEVADLGGRSEAALDHIQRLAQKGRAAGLFVVLATQYPTIQNVPSEIKVNLNTRVAFRLQSPQQSNVVLDVEGAESLLARGDCLFKSSESVNLTRCAVPEFSASFKTWFESEFTGAKQSHPPERSTEIIQVQKAKENYLNLDLCQKIIHWNLKTGKMSNTREKWWMGGIEDALPYLLSRSAIPLEIESRARSAVKRAFELKFDPAKAY